MSVVDHPHEIGGDSDVLIVRFGGERSQRLLCTKASFVEVFVILINAVRKENVLSVSFAACLISLPRSAAVFAYQRETSVVLAKL